MKDYEKMTIKELVDELTGLGISFNKKARKAELLELLLAETGGGDKGAVAADDSGETAAKPAAKVQKAKALTGYAIIRTGGKQYQVSAGTLVRVEKISGNVGDTVELKDILAVVDGENTMIGQPTVAGAVVTARIVEQDRAKKVLVFKKKRRKGYRVKRGHRQMFTALEIADISF